MFRDVEFACRLRAVREEKGLSVQEGAQKCGLAYSTYHGYENVYRGGQTPSVDKLAKICEGFGVSADYLLQGIEQPTYDLDYICEYTGLDRESVQYLHKIKLEADVASAEAFWMRKAINALLQRGSGRYALYHLGKYLFSRPTELRGRKRRNSSISESDDNRILFVENERINVIEKYEMATKDGVMRKTEFGIPLTQERLSQLWKNDVDKDISNLHAEIEAGKPIDHVVFNDYEGDACPTDGDEEQILDPESVKGNTDREEE